MNFLVTHFDIHGHRHRVVVMAASNLAAMAWAEQLYGEARQLRAICIRAPRCPA